MTSYRALKLTNYKGYVYIYYFSYKDVNICLPVELFLPLKVLVYTLVKGIPYIFVASQSGDVVNRLEILFMVGGFRVVCNLNTLVIDRVILRHIYSIESHLSIALLSLVML